MIAYLSLLFVGIVWGSTFIVVKDSLTFIDPFVIITLRFIVASVILYAIVRIKKLNIADHIKLGIISGTVQFCTFVPQVVGLKYTSPTNSAFITGLYILFVPLARYLLQKKLPKKSELLACIVAITGLWIMTGGVHNLNIGDWITFGTAIAIAFYITISAIAVKKGANPIVLTFHQMWVTAALGGICALLRHSHFYTPNYSVYLSMIYLGIFASAIGFLIQNIMLKKVNLIIASILLGTEPLFALIFSWILKYEPIHVTKIIGGLVIFSAIILPDIIKKLKKTMLNKLRLK